MEEAKKAYQSVIAEFADQKDEVTEARSRLAAMEKPITRPRTEGISIKQMWSGDLGILGSPSPDGKYCSYLDWGTGDLGIMEIASKKKRRLTNNNKGSDYDEMAWNSRWSPDGKHIAYDWSISNTYEIRIIGIEGSLPLTIYRGNKDVRTAIPMGWTPDSTHVLAVIYNKDKTRKMVLLSVKGEPMKIIKSLENTSSDHMYFSPDGQYLIYDVISDKSSRNRDIFIYSLDGKLDKPLIEHPADDYSICWSKDGKQIYFVSTRTRSHDLWSIGIENGNIQGEPTLIKSYVGNIIPMGTTKNGSLYFWEMKSIEDVYIAEINPETQTITDPAKRISEKYEGTTREAGYSPNGKYLAYISRWTNFPLSRKNIYKLIIRSLESGQERELIPNLSSILFPRWDPDSSKILASGEFKIGSRGIVQFNLENGDYSTIMPIAKGDNDLYKPEWSKDGKSLYFVRSELRNEKSTILKWDIASQAEKEVLILEGDDSRIHMAVSPDEKWIALTPSYGKGIIKLISLTGEGTKILFTPNADERLGRQLCWTSDGKHLIFVKGKNTLKQSLWKISIDGGMPIKLGLEMKIGGSNLSIHPNGRHIVFNSWTDIIGISVMENFVQETKK